MHNFFRFLIAAVVVAALLAIPGTAMAGDPTSDAYGGVAGTEQVAAIGGSAGGGGGGGGGGGPTAAQGGGGGLPFTGFELGLAAMLGAGLLGTGFVLRRTLGQSSQPS